MQKYEITHTDLIEKPMFMINPTKKKELKKFVLSMIAVGVIGFGLNAWLGDSVVPKVQLAQSLYQNDLMKADMVKMADSGKVSAIIWLASNYPETEAKRLDPLIKLKNSDAMLAKAQILYATDKTASIELLKLAASEGNPIAVKFINKSKIEDLSFSDFKSAMQKYYS